MMECGIELYKVACRSRRGTTKWRPAIPDRPGLRNANVATDHQMMVMETLKRLAPKYGLACLLHEKPFAGVNGSGKHLNWSMSTDTGENLFNPGETPHQNLQFLIFTAAVLKAVDTWQGLLRGSIASAGNDHRLGANEAPPAIISIFLGTVLTDLFEQIERGKATAATKGGELDTGVSFLPKLPRDAGDRNRTSPFAFTGNKFEFRAVSSGQTIAYPNIALNVAVADAIDQSPPTLKRRSPARQGRRRHLEAPAESHQAAQADHLQRQQLRGRVAEGSQEARPAEPAQHGGRAARLVSKPVVAAFTKHKVLNERELKAREEIAFEAYNKTINIEAQLMVLMANRYILPAALENTTTGRPGGGGGQGRRLTQQAGQGAAVDAGEADRQAEVHV